MTKILRLTSSERRTLKIPCSFCTSETKMENARRRPYRQKNISAKIKVNRQLSTCFEIYLGSPLGSQKFFVGSSLEYIAFEFC